MKIQNKSIGLILGQMGAVSLLLTGINGSDVTAQPLVAAGATHTCVTMDRVSVKCAGTNEYGQLGRNTTGPGPFAFAPTNAFNPALATGETITHLYSSNDTNYARTSLGFVYAWGSNVVGQAALALAPSTNCANGSGVNCAVFTPTRIKRYWAAPNEAFINSFRVEKMAASGSNVLFVVRDTLGTIGSTNSQQTLGAGVNFFGTVTGTASSNEGFFMPYSIAALINKEVTSVALGGSVMDSATNSTPSFALLARPASLGGAYVFGANHYYQLGKTGAQMVVLNVNDILQPSVAFNSFSTGNLVGFGRINGQLQGWGRNSSEVRELLKSDTGSYTPSPVASSIADATRIITGFETTCVTRDIGEDEVEELRCFGRNDYGQAGASVGMVTAPVEAPFLVSKLSSPALGLRHTCVVDTYDQVRCWGDNTSGQLGVGIEQPIVAAIDAVALPQ